MDTVLDGCEAAPEILAPETPELITVKQLGMKSIVAGNETDLPSVSEYRRVLISKRGEGFDMLFDESGVRRKLNAPDDAPADGKLYGRRDGQWIEITDVSAIDGTTPTLTPTQATVWTNVQKSGQFTRNNCGSGYAGSTVVYTVPGGTYSSTVSQADADAKALADIAASGQAYANAHGTCTLTAKEQPTPTPTQEQPTPTLTEEQPTATQAPTATQMPTSTQAPTPTQASTSPTPTQGPTPT